MRGSNPPREYRNGPVVDVWTGVQGNGPANPRALRATPALRTDAKSADGFLPEATACALTFLTDAAGRREMLRSNAALRAEVRGLVKRLTRTAAQRAGVVREGRHPKGSKNPEVVRSERAWATIGDATGVFTEK